MTPDCDLLRQYAERQDEAAFAELVRRHMDLVYSVALRQANGDAQLALDVTQVVFLDLARKARALSQRATLAGWLHTSARFAASKAVRGEQRRHTHEQEASAMHENTIEVSVNWEQLRPLLDEGVGQLDEADRDAIVLRFFQGKSHREVGAILGLNENSANKRIERALEKLRAHFARRGVAAPSLALAAAISENAVQAAPEGLAAGVVVASLAGAGVGAGLGTATGNIFLKILLMSTKTKLLFAAAAILAVAAPLAISFNRAKDTSAIASEKTAASAPVAQSSKPSAPGNASSTAGTAPTPAGSEASGANGNSPGPVASGTNQRALIQPPAQALIKPPAPALTPPPAVAVVTANNSRGLSFATTAPANGAALVSASIGVPGVPGAPGSNLATLNALEAKPPLAEYYLTLADMANGSVNLDALQPYDYIYLVESSGQVVARGAVRSGAARAALSVGDSWAAQVEPALEYLAGLDQVKSGSYEARIVSTQVVFLAVWLKSPSGADLIYPIMAPSGIERNKLYTVPEFLQAMQPVAQRYLQLPNRSGP